MFEFENILKHTEEKSSGDTVEDRKYKDLVKGRFKITVTRIEPEGYEHSISGKRGRLYFQDYYEPNRERKARRKKGA